MLAPRRCHFRVRLARGFRVRSRNRRMQIRVAFLFHLEVGTIVRFAFPRGINPAGQIPRYDLRRIDCYNFVMDENRY